jgi:hypothetical protein
VRLEKVVPNYKNCIDTTHLGDSQLASFIYFTDLKLKDDPNCSLWISNNPGEVRRAADINQQQIELIWEDGRVSDRSERLRLYRVKSNAQ